MVKKIGKSYGDVEEGTHHCHGNESDEENICYSDAEENSWHSPYSSHSVSSVYDDDGASIDELRTACRKSCVSDSSLDHDDLESGDSSEARVDINKAERDCRICHLSLEKSSPESGTPIVLGCSCKDDLAAAHEQCAETWFKIRGNRICEICGSTARNVVGATETETVEQRSEVNASTIPPPPSETRSIWEGRRFLKFLLACLVLAFVVSWLFRFNVPG